MSGRVVVVGGGIAGAGAALRLARAGREVVLLERSEHLGGLVVSFEIAGTPLECFYHHVFPQERTIAALLADLGLAGRLDWLRSSVAVLTPERVWPFTSPGDLLRFGPLPPADRLRTGIAALRVARVADWRPLDRIPAIAWLESLTGPRAVEVVWGPLLGARFGRAADRVPAAWMWARFRHRAGARRRGGEWLGYLRGGFRQLFDALTAELMRSGVDVRLGSTAVALGLDGDRVSGLETGDGMIETGEVVYAGTLPGLSRLVPAGRADPRWSAIGGLGALCVILEMTKPLGDPYWTNVCDPSVPFGGVIEHTNLVPAADYGGRHVVYLSRYFLPDEEIATLDPAVTAERWIDVVEERYPRFRRADLLGVHPFRTPYAAPLVEVGHVARIPPVRSHLRGLTLTTSAQIYPDDRGMNDGLRNAVRAADGIARDDR